MEFKKQRIQHRIETEGIPRKTVKGNRSTSVQQTWRAISPDWSWRTEGQGRGAPRNKKHNNPKQ